MIQNGESSKSVAFRLGHKPFRGDFTPSSGAKNQINSQPSNIPTVDLSTPPLPHNLTSIFSLWPIE